MKYRTIVADPPWRYGSVRPDSQTYTEYVHDPPPEIGRWLQERRKQAGLSLVDVAKHFPSRTGRPTGCVSNWEGELNRPTPGQWRKLREVVGFDGRYDRQMTETCSVVRSDPIGRGHAARCYETLTTAEIAALPITGLAAKNAHLWLWGVNALLDAAYDVARAWGFEPITVLTWCKRQPGVGYYLRNNTEHCLFATRGKPQVPDKQAMASWFVWPRSEHSAKPEAFYDLVEQVSPAPRVELFARRARFGWDYWGNESLGTAEMVA